MTDTQLTVHVINGDIDADPDDKVSFYTLSSYRLYVMLTADAAIPHRYCLRCRWITYAGLFSKGR